MTYLKPDTYSEPFQRFKMEFLAEIVKNYNYFFKALHLRFLTGFWKLLSLSKYSLTCRMISRYVLSDTYSESYYRKFRQSDIFTSYSDIFSHFVAYSEPCHIQNPGIFRTQDMIRTLSRYILAHSERCATLACWEPCHIENFAIFRILTFLGPKAYSESCWYRHIQAYSITIVITFFFPFNLTYFSTKLKNMYVFWLQWRQFQCSTEST